MTHYSVYIIHCYSSRDKSERLRVVLQSIQFIYG